MVGLAGAVGNFDRDRTLLVDELRSFGDETAAEYVSRAAFVTSVFHRTEIESQPAKIDSTGELLWVWGTVYGYANPHSGYESKDTHAPSATNAEYCAHLYRQYGPEFVAGLNGSFVGVILEDESDVVRLFTDRLGSRPIHYTVVDEGVVFSTGTRPLAAFLGDRLSFDPDGVTEYFSFERALGRKTPIEGVERAHPGAITRLDPADGSIDINVQWRPVHEPLDRPFKYFVDRFVEIFESAVRERYDPKMQTGVLLNSGSGSRLLLGALPDGSVTGYHINDMEGREASITKRIADVSENKHRFLRRDGDYYRRAIEFATGVSNYASWFQHGHASGAANTLRGECECLMTGHSSDTLFKNNHLPSKGISVPGTSVEVPLYARQEVATTADLVEMYLGTKSHNQKHPPGTPDYLQSEGLESVLEKNITGCEDGVSHHGVVHESARDAALFSESYPLTNTAGRLFFDVMLQTAPYRDPFLDVRLVELMTELPIRYRLRKNIINAAIGRVRPALAEIPHPNTHIPLTYPFALHYLALPLRWIADQFQEDGGPDPSDTSGSWPNWEEMVRHFELLKPVLDRHATILKEIDWIDAEQLRTDYERHMNGENRFEELSAALSFLANPATRSVQRGHGTRELQQHSL